MRGTGSVYKRGGVWWVSYYVGGKRFRESSGSKHKRDALRLLEKRLGERATGRFTPPASDRVTVSGLLEDLLRTQELEGGRSLRTNRACARHLAAFFGGARASAVSEADVERYKEVRLVEGATPATVNRELAILRRAFRLAHERRILPTPGPRFRLLREENVREGYLTREEVERVAAHLGEDLGDFVRFLFETGWRSQEGRRLTWKHVTERTIELVAAHSKNRVPRVIPVAGPLREILERRRARRLVTLPSGETVLSPWVFHRGDGEPVGDFRKAWRSALRAAGLPETYVLHDLRRSFAIEKSQAGVPVPVIMAIAGWKTDSMFRRYRIVDLVHLEAALEGAGGTSGDSDAARARRRGSCPPFLRALVTIRAQLAPESGQTKTPARS